MIKKGIYAAALSILNEDKTLNINSTISHAESIIKKGLHGVFFFGSTGQSQLIPVSEKKELISKLSTHKLKKQFFLGTGNNSLKENVDLIKYAMEYGFQCERMEAIPDQLMALLGLIIQFLEEMLEVVLLLMAMDYGL